MFPIVIADGKQKMPNDDIYYIVGKEGIFIKKKLGIMESLSPVKNISILESVQTTAKMHIEKLPGVMTAKIYNFFKAVYDKYKAECIVLLFYNEETKKYKIVPPAQKVSGASLDYNRTITIENFKMIGDIHSHANMSAFHSGVDQGDEESFDGLHITFGNLGSETISISASIVSNGHRTMVSPEEYLNGIEIDYEIDEIEKIPTTRSFRWVNGKMIEETSKYSATTYRSYRKYDKRYKIINTESIKAKLPKSWMERVEEKVYSYVSYNQLYGGWAGHYQGGYWEKGKWVSPKYNRGWGNRFDSDIWKQNQGIPTNKHPLNVGVQVKPLEFPKHDDENKPVVTEITPKRYIPCETCPFKEKAVEYAAKLLVDEKGGSVIETTEQDDYEAYECTNCGMVLTFEIDQDGNIEGDITCPECKTDEHLIDITEDYVESSSEEDQTEEVVAKNIIRCKTCQSEFDLSMLVEDSKGGACPICYTLIVPNQELNYEKEGDQLKCNSCNSQFTYDLAKNSGDKCPFCKETLLKIGEEKDLLGPDLDKIEEMAKKEIEAYKAEKEKPNPARIITPPNSPLSAFIRLKNKVMGKRS